MPLCITIHEPMVLGTTIIILKINASRRNFGETKSEKIHAHRRKWEIFSRDKKGEKNTCAPAKMGNFFER